MLKSLMKKSNFQQAVKIIFLFDIFVRVFQFLRELIFSTLFGFSKVTDAFNYTVNIIGTPLNLVADALLVGIIPSLNKKESMQEKINYVYSLMISFVSIIVFLFVIYFSFNDSIMKVLAPGFDSETVHFTMQFSWFYACIGLLLVLNRIIDNFFKAEKIFGLANFSNLVSAVISILILYVLYEQTHLAITYGMLVGSLVSFIILYSRLPLKRMTAFDKDAIQLIKNSLPLLISGGLGVINTFVDKSFGTLLDEGAITILSYATMIVLLVSSILTNAISGASYSFIASEVANNQLEKVQERVSQINFFFLFIYSTLCILFVLIGEYFLGLLFNRGNITAEDVEMLYRVTLVFIPMTIFTSIGSIVVQIFYSFNNLKVTTVINSLCVVLNILLNYLFIDKFGIFTLAGSTLIASIAATLINAYFLQIKYKIWAINLKIMLIALIATSFTIFNLITSNMIINILIIIGLVLLFLLLFKNENKNIKRLFLSFLLRR